MLFQQKRGKLPADQHRHILPLRQRRQLLLALAFEHPSIGRLRPLRPPLAKCSRLAFHGQPPSCIPFHVTHQCPHFNRKTPAQERECTQAASERASFLFRIGQNRDRQRRETSKFKTSISSVVNQTTFRPSVSQFRNTRWGANARNRDIIFAACNLPSDSATSIPITIATDQEPTTMKMRSFLPGSNAGTARFCHDCDHETRRAMAAFLFAPLAHLLPTDEIAIQAGLKTAKIP